MTEPNEIHLVLVDEQSTFGPLVLGRHVAGFYDNFEVARELAERFHGVVVSLPVNVDFRSSARDPLAQDHTG
jgi:hypothetical protein